MIGSNNLEKGMIIRSACEHFRTFSFNVFLSPLSHYFGFPDLKLREFVHRLTRENIPIDYKNTGLFCHLAGYPGIAIGMNCVTEMSFSVLGSIEECVSL